VKTFIRKPGDESYFPSRLHSVAYTDYYCSLARVDLLNPHYMSMDLSEIPLATLISLVNAQSLTIYNTGKGIHAYVLPDYLQDNLSCRLCMVFL